MSPENPDGAFLNFWAERAPADDRLDLGQVPMRLLTAVEDHPKLGPADPLPGDPLGVQLITTNRQACERIAQGIKRQPGVEQGAEKHIAGEAGEAIEIGDVQ